MSDSLKAPVLEGTRAAAASLQHLSWLSSRAQRAGKKGIWSCGQSLVERPCCETVA